MTFMFSNCYNELGHQLQITCFPSRETMESMQAGGYYYYYLEYYYYTIQH